MGRISTARMSDCLVEAVKTYFFEDPEFATALEQWAVDNCQDIDNSSDEMKLHYTELYNKLVEAYEAKMTDFLESQGSSVEEFHKKLQEAPRDGEDAHFVDMMLMILDFETFMQMMREVKANTPEPSPK